MISDLFSLVERHAEEMPRIFVDWGDWWAAEGNEHRLYLSAHGSAWDDCCHRQICTDAHAPYPELSLLAPYLRLCRTRGDDTRPVDHPWLLDRRPPLYFDGAVEAGLTTPGELVYVDLVAAYWAIYTRTTLDVSYSGLGSGPVRGGIEFLAAERLGAHKLLRNALLGSLRRTRRRGIDHGEPFVEEVPASARRPNLWGLVMDALELVAWRARLLGAVYVHTDGYVFAHPDLADDFIDAVKADYGLVATVRHRGPGVVYGLGRWQIGEETRGFRQEPGHDAHVPAGTELPHAMLIHDDGDRQYHSHRVDSMMPVPELLAGHLTEWLYHASFLSSAVFADYGPAPVTNQTTQEVTQ